MPPARRSTTLADPERTRPGRTPLICDVGAVRHPDARTVDALARLQLTARRRGLQVWLRDASPELRELLALMGLEQALPCRPGAIRRREASGVEPRGQAEGREEARRVQEEGDAADPPA